MLTRHALPARNHPQQGAVIARAPARPELTPSAFDRRRIPAAAGESRWIAADGHQVRRIDWREPMVRRRGSLLFLPGRGDPYEKYLETLQHWHLQGWHVSAADWRGQGGSGRFGRDPLTGHIDDFATWVDDLAGFWAGWKAGREGPFVIVAHSMGGHLALRAAAEGRIDPDALVLTAPMLGLARRAPLRLLQGTARLMSRVRDPRRPAWRWSEKPGSKLGMRQDILTHDRERYADELWWREHRPDLAMGPGSWGWIERACESMRLLRRPGVLEQVRAPVLILATTHDALVGFGAIRQAIRRLPKGELVRFGEEARHEILREVDPVRHEALRRIDRFLDRVVPPPGEAGRGRGGRRRWWWPWPRS